MRARWKKGGPIWLLHAAWPLEVNVYQAAEGVAVVLGKRPARRFEKIIKQGQLSEALECPLNHQLVVIQCSTGDPAGRREPLEKAAHSFFFRIGPHKSSSKGKAGRKAK